MHRFAILASVMLAAAPAQAEELPPIEPMMVTVAKAPTVACMDGLENGTSWGTCMEMLFQPCAELELGSGAHLDCLLAEREEWLAIIAGEQQAVTDTLTAKGAIELGQLMNQWFGYVANRCAAVGGEKVETGADAAQVGCEMSEMVALVSELVSCRKGRSEAPYCTAKE